MDNIRYQVVHPGGGGLLTSADGFAFVEEVEDVPTPLMVKPENWPQGLDLSFSFVRLGFSCEEQDTRQKVLELEQIDFNS